MRDIYTFYNSFEIYKDIKSDLVIEGRVDNPKITIFIPTYKRADTLEVTVKSALSQITDSEFEILIVNNDPEEGCQETKELLERIADKRIYYYENRDNIGLCGNWNRGIELSRSEYVSMIHDDDILSPYFVDAVLKAIEDTHAGILGVDYFNFTSMNMPIFTSPTKLKYSYISKQSFFFGKYINIAGMTVRRDLVLALGGYSEEYYPNEDTILIYQAIIQDNVIKINHPLAGYRKEINLSLSDGTMRNIVLIMEKTRRNIAKQEEFAEKWMRKYDKEFLYQYILGANNSWGVDLNYKDIFEEVGMLGERPSKIKLLLMKIEMRIYSLGGRK